jgi:diguanylate cyclase (GGDEF)-like protein
VLLFDHDAGQINLAQECLDESDYQLTVVNDPAVLAGVLKDEPPELVISNFDLEGGGVDLVNSLLALQRPPFPYVLFLTDEKNEKFAVDCLGPIPGDFLVKPIREQEFRARVTVAERTIALQNHLAAQQQPATDIAMYDDLTSLFNRQAIYEHALAELSRSQREKQSVCLAVVEILNAARIREQHGNETADLAIRFTARALRANLRMYDLVGRWMPSVFMVLLPGLADDSGQRVIERILGAVLSVNLRLPDMSLVSLEVAAGYTCVNPAVGLPLYELINQANAALVQAAALDQPVRVAVYRD